MRARWLLALCPLLGSVSPAVGAEEVDWDSCFNKTGGEAVAACSGVLAQSTISASDRARAYAARSFHYEHDQRYEEALVDINEAIRLDPSVAFYYDNRSNAERELDQTDKAFADANTALRLDPDDLPAHLNRGLVYFRKKEFQSAIDDFSQYIAAQADVSEGFTFRGAAYGEIAKYDRAIADLSTSIKLGQDGVRPLRYRAYAYLHAKQYDLALRDCSAVLDLNPRDAWVLYARGLAKLALGDMTGNADLAAALAIDSDRAKTTPSPA